MRFRPDLFGVIYTNLAMKKMSLVSESERLKTFFLTPKVRPPVDLCCINYKPNKSELMKVAFC